MNFNHHFTEIADFLTRSHQNKMFIEKGLSARILEVTKQVLVDGIQNYSEEDLQLYFEIESGDVESVIFNKTEQSAIITFKGHQGNSFTLHFRYCCNCTIHGNNVHSCFCFVF